MGRNDSNLNSTTNPKDFDKTTAILIIIGLLLVSFLLFLHGLTIDVLEMKLYWLTFAVAVATIGIVSSLFVALGVHKFAIWFWFAFVFATVAWLMAQ